MRQESGFLETQILRTLSRRDLRGYGIVRVIRQACEDGMPEEEGSLYPALQRLELRGWIDGAWVATGEGRRARIYRITTAGRRRLQARDEGSRAPGRTSARGRLLYGCVAAGAAFGAQPAQDLRSGGIPVDVCMSSEPQFPISTSRATPVVSSIFSEIGVQLRWHGERSGCEGSAGPAFQIGWAARAPGESPAGTLAAARPFGRPETAITIYEAPLQQFLRQYPHAPEVVFAYVLAHELAHVMQGVAQHSRSGILKANWSYGEYYEMLSRRLAFTASDAELIRRGLEARRPRGGLPILNLLPAGPPP